LSILVGGSDSAGAGSGAALYLIRRCARPKFRSGGQYTTNQLTVNPTSDPAELMMFTPLPRPPRGALWPGPRVVILVIILVFVAVMAGFGYTPAVALGLVVAAAAIADDPELARHLGDLPRARQTPASRAQNR
jgi:hypothetical protein